VICAGKDITHKLYSMNEHLLASASAMAEQQAATAALALQKQQELDASLPWHEQRPTSNASENMFLSRSLSVDAVHTGSRGHVRSMIWMERHQQKSSLFSDSKSTRLIGQHLENIRAELILRSACAEKQYCIIFALFLRTRYGQKRVGKT
jgi:hypothetical protein